MESQIIDLKNESNRLATFTGWPISFIISPKSLASAGFYYTKQIDKVKCAFCNICVCRWEFGDNAVDEHKRHNPTCIFILSQNCGNIPIIEGIQLRGEFVETHKESGVPIDIRGLGVRTHRVAFHLHYNSYCARIKTFSAWKNEALKPEELALAGFFFTGSNDEVRCYYCDGGLQNWEEDDNPWVEHAKWFPNCGFLNLVKGDKFLDGNLVERFNALLNRPRSDDPTSSQEVVSIHETDNILLDDTSSSTRRIETTDREIDELMLLPPAINALELGLQTSHIRQAIRNNLQDIGRPFRSMDNFIRQILNQDQSAFPINEDSITLEEILRREGQTWQTSTVNNHDTSSEESENSIESHENEEDFIRYITTDNENDMHISSDSDIDLIEDYDDQNTANMPNEIETSNMDETLIITDSAELCQSNDIENKDEDNVVLNIEPAGIKLSHSDLEEENRKLKEARLCKICLDQELGVVMLPCAHLVACITCASSLPDCPLCRQTIKATVRTFLS